MKQWTFFDKQTGRITGNGMGSLSESSEGGLIEGIFDYQTQYIDPITKTPTARPPMPVFLDRDQILADGEDTANLTSVPYNAVLTFENEDHTVTSGSVALTLEDAGIYKLGLTCFPYQDWSGQITAFNPDKVS